jgi:hypothetical protein
MDEPAEGRSRVSGPSIPTMGLALVFGVVCAWPYARWFAHPSLFDDDFQRAGSLRRSTLGEALFRPFNEHMAPLFETVSWLAWQASGRDILALPLAFQVSAYLAFALTVALFALVAWRELRSSTATLICVASFTLSAVSAETVLWYSASSFEWSAAAMLGAWLFAILGADSPGPRSRAGWLFASGLASLAAPAFSAIGILAGPLAILRFLATVDRPGTVGKWAGWSLLPIAGTVSYLLICQRFAYGSVLSSSVHQNLDLRAALWATAQAPSAVLVPALLGQNSLIRLVPGPVLAVASLSGLLVGLVGAIRSRARPLILGGLALIAGGYFATYATRARPGDLAIFEIQRYHLFPQIGISLLIAAMVRPLLSRFDRSATSSLLAATSLAVLLAIAQFPRMQAASERNFRYADQPRALAATLRLEAICDREGITLIQAMEALDPVQAPWFPKRGPFHPLLYLFANGPRVARLADLQVRSTLVANLSIGDREAFFGGLNATRYRLPDDFREDRGMSVTSRLVGSQRMISIVENQYQAGGRGSWLDFEVARSAGSARALVLPDLKARNDIEVWWAGEDGVWSFFRSVRWTADFRDPGATSGIALDRLPHWRPGFVRKVRLVFREWGPVAVGPPRFVP